MITKLTISAAPQDKQFTILTQLEQQKGGRLRWAFGRRSAAAMLAELGIARPVIDRMLDQTRRQGSMEFDLIC